MCQYIDASTISFVYSMLQLFWYKYLLYFTIHCKNQPLQPYIRVDNNNIYKLYLSTCIKIYRSNNNHIESYIILLQNRTDIYIGRQNVEKIYQYYTYQLQSFFVHSHSFFFGVLSFVCFEIISIHGRLNIDTFLDR